MPSALVFRSTHLSGDQGRNSDALAVYSIFYAVLNLLFCSLGGISDVRPLNLHFVKEPWGKEVYKYMLAELPQFDELSSWRSMNSNFDSCGKSILCATVVQQCG